MATETEGFHNSTIPLSIDHHHNPDLVWTAALSPSYNVGVVVK